MWDANPFPVDPTPIDIKNLIKRKQVIFLSILKSFKKYYSRVSINNKIKIKKNS